MLSMNAILVLGFAVAGIVSHRAYWSRYEFDARVPQNLLGFILAFWALVYIFSRQATLLYAACCATLLFVVYGLALFTTIGVYRLFCHPLRHFQGPYWARVTQWWKVKHIAKTGSHYGLTDDLHGVYGEIVRTGPNSLSINKVEALQAIYGSQSPCTKPPSYLIGGLVSVQSERDPHRHRLRRAVWDKALGSSASNAFFPRLTQMVELLTSRLEDYNGQELSVNNWMHFITFDVMAQFCFSRDWSQVATGRMHQGIKYASEYLKFAVYGTQVPWLAISLMKIPYMPEPQSAMVEFSSKALDERMKQEPAVPDAMSYILNEKDPQVQQFLSRHDIESDVFMIMLAGADTSFSVLVNLCFRLAAHPQYQSQLRDEVDAVFTTDGRGGIQVDWLALSSAGFITALINETLRLHPPVPSGMPRLAPPEGLVIPLETKSPSGPVNSDNFLTIPGNAIISVPTYTIHRNPAYWLQPNDFIPERWTTKPELILDRRAWCPFSLGAYGCAGKYFALMEIKLIIARLIVAFDIEVSRPMTLEERVVWLASQEDWMTLQPKELKLRFVRRETGKDRSGRG